MNDRNFNTNQNGLDSEDTYDVLHKNFSLFGDDEPVVFEDDDVKNSGEIYFSANDDAADDAAIYTDADFSRFASGGSAVRKETAPAERNVSANGARGSFSSPREVGNRAKSNPAPVKSNTAKQTKASSATKAKDKKKKKKKKRNAGKSLLLALVVIAFVVVASLIIRIPVIGCMNDIIAIDRSSIQKMVVLDRDMSTNEVIDLLGQKDLIYSSTFCKIASHFLHFDQKNEDEKIYPAGSYQLSADMGVEGMLKAISTNGVVVSTVTITFPEGYTVDQIVERLATNGVASKNSLYDVMNSDDLYEQYEFLTAISDKDQRYRALEGYLYPDTYEFYIGENPQSVIKRFLDNFTAKWEQKYQSLLEDSGYTMDEIITVASILQKEANDSEQMKVIAGIIYNRLNSSAFPFINCDSTAKYIENKSDELIANGTYADLMLLYDTNQKQKLPAGPICNPGADALAAAVSPDHNEFYYFLHDKDGKIYTASTLQQHEYNLSIAEME